MTSEQAITAAARKRFVDVPCLVMALLPLLAIAFDAWGILYYHQGLRNEPMDLAPAALGVGLILSFAIAGLLLRGYMLFKRGDSRVTFCGLLVPFVMMVWPAMCAMRPMPVETYKRGLAEWARANVDVEAIRAWHATLPPVTSATKLTPKLWVPPAVRKLEATQVEQQANGVMFQWGSQATMPGRERKLFIASQKSIQPPDEGRRFWVEVEPGVYVGTHGPP